MAVAPVTGVGNTTTTQNSKSADQAAASLNYNNFLQLLIAQMKNQDPTDPMDASQQVAQLATFSQVEQSLKMNSNLESLISAQGLGQASSVIGKTVTSADGTISGIVKEVKVNSDGVVATTIDGKQIRIESGITIKSS